MAEENNSSDLSKITFAEYLELAGDLNNREKFLGYSVIERGEGGFDFKIRPNRELVDLTPTEQQLEDAMSIGNSADRAARKLSFLKDRLFNPSKPVIVSEGDSWFQFPIIIKDIIDHLKDDYAILSLGAAGDTAENMVDGPAQSQGSEYLSELMGQAEHVRAFLFSAAGNDIIGEDPVTKVSALQGILREFNGDVNDVSSHINEAELTKRISDLRIRYSKVISGIRGQPALADLPILFHGYDYCFPWPWGSDDPRDPAYAKNDEWLGEPFAQRNFPSGTLAELELRRNIIRNLIDRLYLMLESLAGRSADTRIWVVDCRGVMDTIHDWNDEIHGTSDGFAKVAQRFETKLNQALAGA